MTEDYERLIADAARGLGDDEFWVIDHDEGPLWDTASKMLDVPVIIICEALKCDWDQAQESGFRLATLTKLTKPAA